MSHIPWGENAQADALSQLATVADSTLSQTYIEHLETPKILKATKIHLVEHVPSWMDRFTKYLTDGVVPDNPPEGRQFKWNAS